MNQERIYEFDSLTQGDYPVLIPKKFVQAEKLLEEAHLKTIHYGVTLTITRMRDQCWIPALRQLVKMIIKRCYGCKRFNISHYRKPSQELIPTDRRNKATLVVFSSRNRLRRNFYM